MPRLFITREIHYVFTQRYYCFRYDDFRPIFRGGKHYFSANGRLYCRAALGDRLIRFYLNGRIDAVYHFGCGVDFRTRRRTYPRFTKMGRSDFFGYIVFGDWFHFRYATNHQRGIRNGISAVRSCSRYTSNSPDFCCGL